MKRIPDWFLGSLRLLAGQIERALCVAAAAASVQPFTQYVSPDEPSRLMTHDEWAIEVVQHADALRRAVRRA